MKPDFSCQPTVNFAQKVMQWRRVVSYRVYIFVVSVLGKFVWYSTKHSKVWLIIYNATIVCVGLH